MHAALAINFWAAFKLVLIYRRLLNLHAHARLIEFRDHTSAHLTFALIDLRLSQQPLFDKQLDEGIGESCHLQSLAGVGVRSVMTIEQAASDFLAKLFSKPCAIALCFY